MQKRIYLTTWIGGKLIFWEVGAILLALSVKCTLGIDEDKGFGSHY